MDVILERLLYFFRHWWMFRAIRRAEYGGAWAFIWRITVQHYLVQFALIPVVGWLIANAYGDRGEAIRQLRESPLLLVWAASLETVFFQTLPIQFMRALGRPHGDQFVAGVVLFALAHFAVSVGVGITAGIVGGMYYSYIYLEYREHPWWVATFVTAAAHALHNALPVYLFL